MDVSILNSHLVPKTKIKRIAGPRVKEPLGGGLALGSDTASDTASESRKAVQSIKGIGITDRERERGKAKAKKREAMKN